MQGLVSDIQRFSLHDGPGIRTTVFLKGCNLRCRWCHNPETLRPEPELQVFPQKCVGCGACLKVCPRQAHQQVNGQRVFLRERCLACGACAAECCAEALVLTGRKMEAAEVAAKVLEDREFYRTSGGGVTLSGGEPLFQPEFAREILALARQAGLHTAVETNLAFPWERVALLLPVTDLLIFDLKAMDPELHQAWTGARNGQILENIRRLAGERYRLTLVARTPIVPGVNDRPEEIGRVAEFLAPLSNLAYYELIPYHPLGMDKYRSLGLAAAPAVERPSAETLRRLAACARQRGVEVWVAGEPFTGTEAALPTT